MAFTKNVNKTNAKFKIPDDFKVTNVRVVTPTFVSFNLLIPGLSLYNMKLVETKKGDRFVAPPSEKSKNGEYYNLFSLYLSDEDQKKVQEALERELEKSDGKDEIPF